jgi:hypothetical protein
MNFKAISSHKIWTLNLQNNTGDPISLYAIKRISLTRDSWVGKLASAKCCYAGPILQLAFANTQCSLRSLRTM